MGQAGVSACDVSSDLCTVVSIDEASNSILMIEKCIVYLRHLACYPITERRRRWGAAAPS